MPGAYQTSLRDTLGSFIGGGDAFVTRINVSGSALLSSTYYGGSAGEQVSGIALDSSGRVYLAGNTDSSDLPVSPDALKSTIGSGVCAGDGHGNSIPCSDVFIARFDASVTKLEYATYLGGAAADYADAITIDQEGYLYVAGGTSSADFPATADAFQPCSRSPGFEGSAFITKFRPGGPLAYSTLLGGSGGTAAASIAVDSSGHIDFIGSTFAGYFFPVDFPPAPVPLLQLGSLDLGGILLGMIDPSTFAPPARISCIVNGASMLGGSISSGEVVEIIGKGLGPEQAAGPQLTSFGTLSASLSGVQVIFNGIAAPLISVQSQRILAIVPYYLSQGAIQSIVQVVTGSATTPVFPINVVAASPAIFSQDGSGTGPAAVLNEDGTLNSPANPASKGSVISIFCTGLGTVMQEVGDGTINKDVTPTPAGHVVASVGGYLADILFAGGAPGQVYGVFQVNARLSMEATSGAAVPVFISVDSTSTVSGNGIATATISIR